MEAVAIGASIIAFIQVADRVIHLCKSYLEIARDASPDLRAILIETSVLRTILENLQFLESCGHSPTALHTPANKEGPIVGCLRVIKEIEGLFPPDNTTLTQPGSSSKRRKAKRQKVQLTLASLAWPFKENKARKLLGELVQYKTTINLAVSTESFHDIKDIKGKANEIHATLSEIQRREVYKWLRSTDPSSLHHQACEKYEPGTSDWVLRSDEWMTWFEEQRRSVWIHGIPGAGKTVLASHLIEHVKTQCKKESVATRKIAHVYYYCYFGHNQNEAIPFLKWTVGQLCRKADLVPSRLYELYKDSSEPSLSDLLEVLKAIVQVYDRIYVIVDAIDESIPRHDLLRVLRELATDSRFQNVSTLSTSRRYIDIEETMLKISAPVSMTNPLLDEDIKLYVESQLRAHPKMSHWPADIQHEVLEALSAKAKGMFRWVVCQFDILQHLNPDSNSITNALADLPETLDETYERIFLGIPQYAQIFVHQALNWIYSHRALCGHSISVPILLQAAQRSSPRLALCSNEFADGLEFLRKFCGCLITVTLEDYRSRFVASTAGCVHTVSFAHYTVWEFLDSSRIRNGPAKFFAVNTGSTEMEFAKMLMLDALSLATYQLLDLENLCGDIDEESGILDNNFSLYLIICSIFSLQAWGSRICQRDDLRILAFNLLDPSKPHFEEFKAAASLVEHNNCLYDEWRNYDQFWSVRWHAEPKLNEVKTLLNLLYTDESCELGKKFLENRSIRDIMGTQLDIYVDTIASNLGIDNEDADGEFPFEGSLREFCEVFESGEQDHFKRFLEDIAEHLDD